MNFPFFDMQKTGRTIAALRRERNMTQMQLADEMGVSFQAVSNWERGQSMPDISKLPELATLFHVTVDHLLGCRNPLLEQAAQGELTQYLSDNGVTETEALQAAPLLPPQQFEQVSEHLADNVTLMELLPFLPTAKVDSILRKRLHDGQDITSFLPFASDAVLTEAAQAMEAAGQSCVCLAPFLSETTVNAIAQERMQAGRSFVELAPFMSSGAVARIAMEQESHGESCAAFAPFLPADVLDKIVLNRCREGKRCTELLPFVGNRLLEQLAEIADHQE